ncbi:MAG: carboxypeptidase regulatory-like domain-containing protein [Deltaproteobacteria bacterium]|nr:carboxypeptidase regulatory-like domain-containing protein [Deltaproteobacteria bacterium]
MVLEPYRLVRHAPQHTLSMLLVGTLSLSCSSDKKEDLQSSPVTTAVVIGQTLSATGAPIANASVSDGTKSTTTNEQGFFNIEDVSTAGPLTLTVIAGGHAKSSKVVVPQAGRSTFVRITLLPFDAVQTISSASGGTVSGGGGEVTFPANAFSGLSGDTTLTAKIAILDASREVAAFPGELVTEAGTRLETFGAMAIEVSDDAGHALNLAAGTTAAVKLPVPNGSPDAIPLWSFDESTGKWEEEGTLTGCADGLCEGTIGHLSWWNADQVMETTCLNVCVKDVDGAPAPGVSVEARGSDYSGNSSAYTGADGCACLEIKRDAQVGVVGISSSGVTDPVSVSTSVAAASCGDVACARLETPLVVSPPIFQAILTWDVAPDDLDTHLLGPCDPTAAGCEENFHVFYSDRGSVSAPPWAYLDTDDTDSYGPEITTLVKALPGVYRYAVLNYSGSPNIATSGAKVFVLLPDGSSKTIEIPTDNPEDLPVWIVGELTCQASQGSAVARSGCSWRTLNSFGPSTVLDAL